MFRRNFPRAFAYLVALCLCFAPLPRAAAAELGAAAVLLVAAEGMKDPRFHRTVVLVTRHGRNQAPVGVIFNRVLDLPLDRLFPQVAAAAQHRLHYGGPVAPGQIVFLARGEVAPSGAIAIGERLFLGSRGDSLLQLLGAPTPATQLRVFHGFASWAPDQLEHEIARGDWHVLQVDADALFAAPLDELWPKLLSRARQVMVRVAGGSLDF